MECGIDQMGGGPLKLSGLEAGSRSSQREAKVLALGMRTGPGLGGAADCRTLTAPHTAAGSEAHGRKGFIGSGLQHHIPGSHCSPVMEAQEVFRHLESTAGQLSEGHGS